MVLRVMLILGTRPQFIKSAPIIHQFLKRRGVELQIVNSEQHYDYELSRIFFEELRLPPPALSLRVGSGSHASQTGKAMVRIERGILALKPDIVLVPGDTNTTLAAALAATKLNVPIGHIEAGARSYDMSMPEEINRTLTDHVSALLFAPTKNTELNLRAEGISRKQILQLGNTMVDALRTALPLARKLKQSLLRQLDLNESEYVLTTSHRPANVDDPDKLHAIVEALARISDNMKVVFPMHPRIARRLKSYGLHRKLIRSRNIIAMKPQGYVKMIALLDSAGAALTDSGGLQKEAFLLGTPCVTMRQTTEWPETLKNRANVLVGAGPDRIVNSILRANKVPSRRPIDSGSPFGTGRSSERIVRAVLSSSFPSNASPWLVSS